MPRSGPAPQPSCRGGTPSGFGVASSGLERTLIPAPPGQKASCMSGHRRSSTMMVGVAMVGNSSLDPFARNELLGQRLAGCAFLGLAAPASRGASSVVSYRMLYRFADSLTGHGEGTEFWCVDRILFIFLEVIVKTRPARGDGGISECIVKVSVIMGRIPGSTKEEECAPGEYLVVSGKSGPG